MSIVWMRRIDYWLGIPLCWVLSGFARFFSGRKTEGQPQTLVIELSEMGSAILADPMMQYLKQQQHQLYFVIFKNNKNSLALLQTVPEENIICIDPESILSLLTSMFRFMRFCQRQKITHCIDLELFSRFTAILGLISGAGTRVGFHRFSAEGLYRGDLHQLKVLYNPHLHIAQNFMALAYALHPQHATVPPCKINIPFSSIQLQQRKVTAQERSIGLGLIHAVLPDFNPQQHQLMLVNPNAGDMLPHRRWPIEYVEQLLHIVLAAKTQLYVLLTGSWEEWGKLNQLYRSMNHPRLANAAGMCTLPQLPFVYAHADLLLSNDSGPAHFAATVALPTVVLFGPESPHLYQPLNPHAQWLWAQLACSPCVSAANHRNTQCQDNQCMKKLLPSRVADICLQRLERQRSV